MRTDDRKIAQFEEPIDRRMGVAKRSQKPAGRKVLQDRLDAARADLLRAIERRELHGRRSWWGGDVNWYQNRYHKAVLALEKVGR